MRYLSGLASAVFVLLAIGFVRHNAHAAIAFDNASSGVVTPGSTITYGLTVTSTANRILFVNVKTFTNAVSSVTYNGGNLTVIGSTHETYNNTYDFLYYMVAADTGTHDVVVTLPSSTYAHSTAASYTGASQSSQPDTYTTSNGTASGGTYSVSLTTGADNSWVVMGAANGNTIVTGVGSGTTQRAIDEQTAEELVDSNGPISPAGSKTLNVTGQGSSDHWAAVIASFKPERIAFDNASSGVVTPGTTITYSQTVSTTATNRILFVNVKTFTTSVNSVTFNGSALTLIGSTHETYNNTYDFLYYMVAPATGTHDIVVTLPSSTYAHSSAASYTGASQTGVPDVYTTSNGTASGGTYSVSLTTDADYSWVVMGAANGNTIVTGVGSDTTQRAIDEQSAEELVDSNGPISPAGSRTLNVTGQGPGDHWAAVMASFKP